MNSCSSLVAVLIPFLGHVRRTAVFVFVVLFGGVLAARAAETTLWEDNFDTGVPDDRWAAENGVWEIGLPTSGPLAAHSGTNVAGTILAGNYPPTADTRLIRVQSFVVPAANQNPRLRFYHWYSFSSLSGLDKGWVEVKAGGGAWVKVSEEFTHVSDAWTRPLVDLTPYAGQTVQVAFHFTAGDFNGNADESSGWYLDDVAVETGVIVFNNPEGFESGLGDWSADRGLWQAGAPTSGPNAAHTGANVAGTVLGGNYTPTGDSRLTSPVFVVPAANQNPRLRFYHWYSFSSLSGLDKGWVEVKAGGGAWVKVSEEFTHVSNAWTRPLVDLTPYAGQTVQVAFRFTAGDFNGNADESSGWYIDDVAVETGAIVFNNPEGFESGLGDWSADRGLWQVGTPTSGPNAAHTGANVAGTVLGANYTPTGDSRLTSPVFVVPAANQNPRLRFYHWYSFSSLSGLDKGWVEVKAGSGAWVKVSEEFTHVSDAWTRPLVDLTPYAGQTVQVAFHFTAGDFNGNADESSGWYIDDVAVETGAIVFNNPESFESGLGDWSADRGLWQVGAPTSGPNAAHTGANLVGTVLGGNYTPTGDSRLTSPVFVVPAANQNPRLRFYHWYSFSSLSGLDKGWVEVKAGANNWVPVSPDYINTSGGWTRPLIDLTPYAGQTVQVAFRFTAGDFNGNADESSGWYIDDILVEADLITPIPDATINEEVLHTITPTIAGGPYAFSLLNAPDGMTVNPSSGVISWTPTELQGPGTYPNITLVATDLANTLTPVDTAAFTLTVSEVNVAPVLTALPPNQTLFAGRTATGTATATDQDRPALQTLTFSLVNPPTGATINPTTGAFSWTPSASFGGTTTTITVRVTDNGTPNRSADGTFQVSVHPAPTITTQPAPVTTVLGGSATFTVAATPNLELSYQWRHDGVTLAGRTAATLSLTGLANADAGVYDVIVCNPTGCRTSNPAVLTVDGLDPHIVLGSLQRTYTGLPQGAAATTTPAGLAVTFTYNGNASPPVNVGSYEVAARVNGGGYVGDVNGVLTIAKATLTVTAANASRTYGASNPAFTSTYAGFVNGETSTVLDTAPSAASAATVASNVGSYPITVNGGADNNYAFTYVSGTLTITKAPLTARADNKTRAQAEANPPLTVTYLGLLVGDAAAAIDTPPTTATTAIVSSPAGDYPITLSGGADNNYALTLQAGTLTITPPDAPPAINTQPRSQSVPLGTDVTFTVVATGKAPLAYQWFKNGAVFTGRTATTLVLPAVTIDDEGTYSVRVSNSVGSIVSELASLAVFAVGDAPTIVREPADQVVKRGGRARFRVEAEGASPLAYQWFFGAAALTGKTGDTLLIDHVGNAEVGSYHVVVSNSFGQDVSRDASMQIVGRSHRGCYFGQFGGNRGRWAFYVRPDNTAVFCGWERGSHTPIIHRGVVVGDDGRCRFRVSLRNALPAGMAAAAVDLDVDLIIADTGALTGVTGAGELTLSGAVSDPNGVTAALAGYYQAGAAAAGATSDFIVGPSGEVFVVTSTQIASTLAVSFATEAAFDSGFGTIDANGTIVITTESNAAVSGTVNAVSSVLAASATPPGGTPVALSGANNDARSDIEKLINISTRGLTLGGSDVMIAGFVVQGTRAKQVLIRCVGPTLGTFGVSGVLPAARLELYSGATLLAQAEDWGAASNAPDIVAAARRVSAFELPFTSRDSVMLAWLQPGTYTVHSRGQAGATGVCLVEAYDATDDARDPAEQRLINISTRGRVGQGDSVMIAGFVVNGAVPKRVLIRGVGPGLDVFLPPDTTLDDAQLTLFDRNGATITANDDWGVGNDVAEVQQASTAVSAFALPVGSKDAVLLLNLAPGTYTVHLRGVGGATGVGIVEVYEVP